MIAGMGSDLQRIADEVARIEREFEGRVTFTVFPDPKFQMVLIYLNVRFRGRNLGAMLIHLRSSPTDPSTLPWLLKHGGCFPRSCPFRYFILPGDRRREGERALLSHVLLPIVAGVVTIRLS